jgi:hypothetical protein
MFNDWLTATRAFRPISPAPQPLTHSPASAPSAWLSPSLPPSLWSGLAGIPRGLLLSFQRRNLATVSLASRRSSASRAACSAAAAPRSAASYVRRHCIAASAAGDGSFWVSRSRPEGGDLARLAEHLIDVAGMQFLRLNHLPRVLLEHHRLALHDKQELLVERERLAL